VDEERLQRRLARAGVASRRGAEALIAAGRVTVDGEVAELGRRVGPDALVEVDGVPLPQLQAHATYLVHKPRGLLSTVRDDRGRPTVMSLVPPHPGLHPVGRLDLDSEGLLLLTSDGDLTYLLTHPSQGHSKRYRVWCVEGRVAADACARLERGVDLDDGSARAVQAQPRSGGVEVVLEDGRKRQVRRMMAAVGYRVERLLRTHVGPLSLGELAPGEARRATAEELALVGYDPSGSREGNPTASPRRDEG
jgi:23S rRNA pseudouridine2605 synthase